MLQPVSGLRADVRYAVRQVRRSPGFAVVAVLSLALGIGANTTVYSVVHSVLARPLNLPRADELVRVYRGEHSPLPPRWFLQFNRNSRTLSSLIAEDPMMVGVAGGAADELAAAGVARASVVSENFFSALGVKPALGAVFSGRPSEPIGAVTVLGYHYWRVRFGSDSAIVGHTIRINDLPFTVVGVAQADFQSSQYGWPPDLFVPMSEQAALRGLPPDSLMRSSFYITGRLARGHTRAQAEAELNALAPELPDITEESLQSGFRVDHARGITAEVRGPATLVSAFLLFVVGTVLLVACANLANLLLARAAGRRREVAIRLAIGVGRWRLVRQLLTESAVLGVLGALLGLAVAFYVTKLLPTLLPAQSEMQFNFTPDLSVLAFTTLLAGLTVALFGLMPALQASRADIQLALRSQGGSGTGRSRLRSAFLAAQVSLATVLLMAAALFLRGLGNAERLETGYRSNGVVDLPIGLNLRQYDDARGAILYHELLEQVQALPQVEAATLTDVVPLTGSSLGTGVAPAEADPNDRRAFRGTSFNVVGPDYFQFVAIPIVAGRGFDAGDLEDTAPVAIVNETLARTLWPDRPAVGQRVRFDDRLVTVVGVARDVKYTTLAERNVPFTYLPLAQNYRGLMTLQARLKQDAPPARSAVRQVVQALDPALPLPPVTSFAEDMQITLLLPRAGAAFLSGFGGLALLLAALGVYGVTAYVVAQKRAEIGIRTALGATAGNVLRLVFGETARLVAVGLALGLAGGIAVGRVLSSQLYGVGAFDPAALATAAAVLTGAAFVATWVPARRALAVDPIKALRSE